MSGETNLSKLIEGMSPKLHQGAYVFVALQDTSQIARSETFAEIKESEGTTLVLEKNKADELGLSYEFIASWITLIIHSSLEAVGLTAAFSGELAKHGISCNVIAGYYHDHPFVPKPDEEKAMEVLLAMSTRQSDTTT